MIALSDKLKAEIQFMQETFAESADDGEALSTAEALRRLMEDCDDKQTVAAEFKQELRKLEIELGITRVISQNEMDNTYVTRGKKYDFKANGIFYVFDSWEPLDKLTL